MSNSEREPLMEPYPTKKTLLSSSSSLAMPSPAYSPSHTQLSSRAAASQGYYPMTQAAEEEERNAAMCKLVERRLSSLRSLTLVGALLFGFSTSVMALSTAPFNSRNTHHYYIVLLSTTVTLSAFALLTYLVHASVCDRLVAEGVPEYAWRLLMKTAIVRLSRRLADLALLLAMACFVILSFLKASDALSGNAIHHVLVIMGVGLVVVFAVMTAPLAFMYYRRP